MRVAAGIGHPLSEMVRELKVHRIDRWVTLPTCGWAAPRFGTAQTGKRPVPEPSMHMLASPAGRVGAVAGTLLRAGPCREALGAMHRAHRPSVAALGSSACFEPGGARA